MLFTNETLDKTSADSAPARPIDRATWGWLMVAGVVLVAFRYHAFDVPLETDECNYAYVGQRLLHGDRLYVDVWDHQPFGVFVLFAGVIAAFGDAPEVFRWLATGCALASMLLIFGILRRVSSDRAACMGAMLFAVVSPDPGTAGDGVQREVFMNTLILAAWYLALRGQWFAYGWAGQNAEDRFRLPSPADLPGSYWVTATGRSYLWELAAGLCLALASALKTNAAVHWLLLAAWIAVRERGMSPLLRRQVGPRVWCPWRPVVCFALGPLILWGATFGYFAVTDRWREFIEAVFLFNVGYSEGSGGFLGRFVDFFTPQRFQFPYVFESALPLWIAGGAATLWLGLHATARGKGFPRERVRDGNLAPAMVAPAIARSHSAAILLLVLAGYIATCLPARFWPHYYYLMIPPLVIATAAAAGAIADFAQRRAAELRIANSEYRIGHQSVSRPLPTFAIRYSPFAILLAALLFTQYRHYLSEPPFGITVKRYNSRDFWGRGQGENVARVTRPDDAVFVFGNDAEIYYCWGRRCASRYTMITGLADGMRGADERRRILLSELRADPPRLILVLFDQEPFPEWKAFLAEFYGEPVGWDFHDQTRKPIMFVLARKDQPVEPIDWDWDRSSVGGWQLGSAPRP